MTSRIPGLTATSSPVDADGLSAEGLAVGNLIVAVVASVGTMAITLLPHPTESCE